MIYLRILGMGLIIFGIAFIGTFIKEKVSKFVLVKGKIVDDIRAIGPQGRGFEHTPVIEYQYKNTIYRTNNRISTPKSSKKYEIGTVVELKIYENKPDKAIINDKINESLPLILGISVLIIGVVLVFISLK